MYKILIADDEPKVIQLIKALIEWDRLDIELVATVRDGKSAFREIEKLKPDIVITDIRMPGYDGIELIRQVRRLKLKVDFIIVSGYQHFDYAHNAIKYDVKDYLLKPLKKEEINQTLKKMVDKYKSDNLNREENSKLKSQFIKDRVKIRENFSKQLFTNYSDTLSVELLKNDFYIDFNRAIYKVICVKPDIIYSDSNNGILRLLLEKTRQVVSRVLRPFLSDMIVYDHSGYLYAFICYDKEEAGQIRQGIMTIINEIHGLRDLFEHVAVTVALSDEFVDINEFNKSLEVLKIRISDKILSSTNRIIDTSFYKVSVDIEGIYFSKEQRDIFINIIRELNVLVFDASVKSWASRLSLSKDISGHNYFRLSHMLLDLVSETLSRFDLLDDTYRHTHPYSDTELHMEHTVYALFEKVSIYCCSLLSAAYEIRKQKNLQPITEAINYIDTHFSQPITLELMSSKVAFNASYFSTLFKRETGNNFLEYLTSVRMEEAKRILSQGQVKTGHIGSLVGYSDNKHFAKQFKKHTGLTPSQYKKLYF